MAGGKQTHVVAFSLPKELFRELEALRLRRFQKRSEIVKEAIREYIDSFRAGARGPQGVREAPASYESEAITEDEKAAFARGEAEYRRGEYLTLEELRARLRKRRKRNVARRRR
jgi:metal-responsive CopG/Arc/MetJ family transcriptional regulator